MPIHSDDIQVTVCLRCKKLIEHQENCSSWDKEDSYANIGNNRESKEILTQHELKTTSLTKAFNYLFLEEVIV